jgi:hypothetical protein
METILFPEQYNFLWYTSWLGLGSFFFAVYQQKYMLSFIPGIVWINSLNYWRYPDHSWRRYMDIGFCTLFAVYQKIYSFDCEYFFWFNLVEGIALFCFALGIYFYSLNNWWYSTYCHILFHIFANLANLILYASPLA